MSGKNCLIFLISVLILYSCTKEEVVSKPDTGENWVILTSSAQWSPRAGHAATVSNTGRIYISGGFESREGTPTALSDVWTSSDADLWISLTNGAPWPARTAHCMVWFSDYIYIIGGNNNTDYFNDVWRSTNGTTWEDVTPDNAFGERKGMTCSVFNGELFVIGGVDYGGLNEIWKTADGLNWELLPTPPFAPRAHHGATVYNGRLWISGGHVYNESYLRDVWSTADAVSWEQHADLPDNIYGHCSVSPGNGIFIIGGNGNYDDILFSTHGMSWSYIEAENAPFERAYHTCSQISGHLLVTGGSYSENMALNLRNDVWISNR
ncbi:hypothetical protein KKF34_11005 [Myxococcota bacterium]|nr:hypothetical protein [Myxococcota bacterium]MBU1379921.1 hypothetical protein [Myxococcota bacterium]MBU1497394.1 hypothetical protein [Myxococcota bacterium]